MRFGKPVAWQVHKQMMLSVKIHPIGRDQQPLDRTRERGSGVAERETLVGLRVVGALAPEQRQQQRQPLIDKSLSGEIADRLASETVLGDRERRRQRQIGILGLLGVNL